MQQSFLGWLGSSLMNYMILENEIIFMFTFQTLQNSNILHMLWSVGREQCIIKKD